MFSNMPTSRSVNQDFEAVLSFPTFVSENGYEVVDTATMAISQRLIACLNNNRMTDVYLVGEDNVKVAASKYLLGSLSPPLQTLLYNGTEGSSVSIEHCRAKTLQALVEFSCSDMLNTNIWANTEPVEIVEDMVALAKLAGVYALPNLKEQVGVVLSPCLDQLPALACVAYNLVDTNTTAELHAASLDVLRKKPYQAFVRGPAGDIGGIACLSPEKLDTIFRDNQVDAEEIFLFRCLQEWRDANTAVYPNSYEVSTGVAQHLDFSAMKASDIEGIVLPSGIVDTHSLVTGLMTVAKAAEKKGISLRSARRKVTKAESVDGSAIHGKSSRRRFKKPSIATAVLTADASSVSSEDTREDYPRAPVSEVRTPTSPSKKLSVSFRSSTKISNNSRIAPKAPTTSRSSIKSRASKFLGSLRPINEYASERSVDGLLNIPPPSSVAKEALMSGLSSIMSSGSHSNINTDADERVPAPVIITVAAAE